MASYTTRLDHAGPPARFGSICGGSVYESHSLICPHPPHLPQRTSTPHPLQSNTYIDEMAGQTSLVAAWCSLVTIAFSRRPVHPCMGQLHGCQLQSWLADFSLQVALRLATAFLTAHCQAHCSACHATTAPP